MVTRSQTQKRKSPHKADFVSTLHKLDLKEGEEIQPRSMEDERMRMVKMEAMGEEESRNEKKEKRENEDEERQNVTQNER